MQILINEKKEIIGYCTVGKYGGGIDMDPKILPADFFTAYDMKKWLYVNGEVVENPDYEPTPEPEPEPEPEPTPSLEEQVAALTEQNQMLTDCILEMSEIIYGGD